jgi:hypothetical protein
MRASTDACTGFDRLVWLAQLTSWLASIGDGPIGPGPSPRMMNSMSVCVYIYIHTHIYKDIGKFVLLHPCVPVPPTTVCWGPWT